MHGTSYHCVGNILPNYEPKHFNVSGNSQAAMQQNKYANADVRYLSLYFYDPELHGESEIDRRTRNGLNSERGKTIMLKLQAR